MTATPLKPPSLDDLLNRYLHGQADAHAQGCGFAETTGDVVPYEAVTVQPIDPRQAWDDGLAVLAHFPSLPKHTLTVPPEWPDLVSRQAPAVALPFCLGNTPQFVRNLQPFMESEDLTKLLAVQGSPGAGPGKVDQALAIHGPAQILGAAMLRLAGHFDEAEKRLQRFAGPWQAVAANEAAALAWHQGKAKESLDMWNNQSATVPVLFNRGMAHLFLGDSGAAVAPLTSAVAALPETSPWHHLGHLYLTLAETR